MGVAPIDIEEVGCPECGHGAVTLEFRIALRTSHGGMHGQEWEIASDYQPLDGGKGICDACEYTGPIDSFRADTVRERIRKVLAEWDGAPPGVRPHPDSVTWDTVRDLLGYALTELDRGVS